MVRIVAMVGSRGVMLVRLAEVCSAAHAHALAESRATIIPAHCNKDTGSQRSAMESSPRRAQFGRRRHFKMSV